MATVYTGRKKITIPVSETQFLEDPIKYIDQYLGSCLNTNDDNAKECEELQKVYLGEQEILTKTRVNGDSKNNNTVVINHSFRQVEFKKGFTIGNPIEYSMAVEREENDDLSNLTKYFNDCGKAAKDIDKYEDLYKFGIALQYIIPKTEDYDHDNEAPFELYNLEVGKAFKVYSSDAKGSPLFDVIISSELDDSFTSQTLYEVYYMTASGQCVFTTYDKDKKNTGKSEVQPQPFLPIIEYSLNKNRMGIVETTLLLGNAINLISSNQIDNLIDFVNSYIVFENLDTKKDWDKKVEEMRRTRTIRLKSSNPQLPAKVYTLQDTLQHNEINSLYDILKKEMYDINAVPQSSGSVTSGGDTGEARILGNGWESAQNQAKVDTTYVSQFEREFLKKVFKICETTSGTLLDTISPNDIAIKYSINMSNNIYTKVQAANLLYDMNFPYEKILSTCELTSDIHGVGKEWRDLDESRKTSENSQSETSNNETPNSETSTETVDNQVAETTQVDEA